MFSRGFALASLLTLSLASASEAHALDLANEIPKTAFTKPTHAQPQVQADRVVADNVRAIAVMHAVARYEKAGLFAAGDRIVADLKQKKLDGAAAKAAGKLVKLGGATGATKDRQAEIAFVANLVREQFQAVIDQSISQMDAYAALVSSVASSVDAFTKNDVSSNEERDTLVTLGLGMSNAGYAAVHHAAAKHGQVAHELTHVVQQSSVQKAYGAKDAADLIAKLSGTPRATVVKELAIANVASELLLWMRHANEPPKLAARAKSDGVAATVAKLKKLGALHAVTPRPAAKLPKPRPMCLVPGSPRPRPCVAIAAKQ